MYKCNSYQGKIRPKHRTLLRISRRFHLNWLLIIAVCFVSACGKVHYVSRGETKSNFTNMVQLHDQNTLGRKGAKQYGMLVIQNGGKDAERLLMLKRMNGRYGAEGLLFSRTPEAEDAVLPFHAGFMSLAVDNNPQMVGLQLRLLH